MADSILNVTKKMVGIASDDTSFDVDIIVNINSALATLTQIGIGPSAGFVVTDASATYEDFLGENVEKLHMVQMYVFLKTKLGFDPPTASALYDTYSKQIQELEWRLNVHENSSNFSGKEDQP